MPSMLLMNTPRAFRPRGRSKGVATRNPRGGGRSRAGPEACRSVVAKPVGLGPYRAGFARFVFEHPGSPAVVAFSFRAPWTAVTSLSSKSCKRCAPDPPSASQPSERCTAVPQTATDQNSAAHVVEEALTELCSKPETKRTNSHAFATPPSDDDAQQSSIHPSASRRRDHHTNHNNHHNDPAPAPSERRRREWPRPLLRVRLEPCEVEDGLARSVTRSME